MRLDAMERPSCTQLVRHPLFTTDSFGEDFAKELRRKIDKERSDNNSLYKILKGERDNRKQASFAGKFQVSLVHASLFLYVLDKETSTWNGSSCKTYFKCEWVFCSP